MKKKRATIKDVARELGLSIATISRALSKDQKVSALVTEETRKRVLQKAAELDYSPNLLAQGFVTGKTDTLGLLTHHISREMFANQTTHILRAAKRHDYEIVVGMPTDRFPRAEEDQIKDIKKLLSRGIDGLLVDTRGVVGESEIILHAVGELVPVVTFHYPIPNLSGVVLNNVTSFCEATEHLIRLGHERIGFIGTNWNTNNLGSDKGKGYLLAMQKHGLPPELIAGRTGFLEPAYQLGKRFGDQFTALVCREDYTAIGICRGLRELGLCVPEDVAVVGYGNIDVGAYLTPALTTLAIPYEAIAQAAMELMLEQLEGQDMPRQIILKASLVVRESCGAKKKDDEKVAYLYASSTTPKKG